MKAKDLISCGFPTFLLAQDSGPLCRSFHKNPYQDRLTVLRGHACQAEVSVTFITKDLGSEFSITETTPYK